MKIALDKFQIALLSVYLFFNTYTLFYILYAKETFGDFSKPATDITLIFISYGAVIVPFILFLLYIYPFIQSKLENVNNIVVSKSVETKIVIFVLFLQIAFMLFNILAGVNTAGSITRVDIPIKYIFIIFVPDMLFLILYGFARDNKYFKYNLLIYLVSMAQRGWMGGTYFVVVIESYIYFKKYGISKKMIYYFLIVISILILLLPYLHALRSGIRSSFGNLTINELGNILQTVFTFDTKSYIGSLWLNIKHLFGRFQFLTNVYLIFENMETLIRLKKEGEFSSVFSSGLPQLFIYKIFQLEYIGLDKYIISVILEKPFDSSYTSNVQLGWIGWIVAQPKMFIIYFLYSLSLVFSVIFVTKHIGGKYLFFVSWFATLVFLLHGWVIAYISYLMSLIAFFIVKQVLIFYDKRVNNLIKKKGFQNVFKK